ncbi:MAG: ammonium transporter, partial [Chthoniobacterales bacterium]
MTNNINSADTAWMLVATAMVLVMTPAVGFFYGGMVRAKNTLNTMMMSYVAIGFVGIAWAIIGYSLAFAGSAGAVGGLAFAFLNNVRLEAHGSIPHLLFACYQGTFAVITAALISGAIVERMRFGPYLTFIAVWSIVVYAPVAHWVWGGGFLAERGVLDFAGGIVVHAIAGVAALASVLYVGRRRTADSGAHSIPLVALGTGLLWFGWYG